MNRINIKAVVFATFAAFAALVLAACNKQKVLSPKELIHYVEQPGNGFKKEVKAGDWVYTIQYKPVDYIIAIEERGMPAQSTYQARHKALDGTASFNISFRSATGTEPLRQGISDIDAFNTRLSYYLNEAQRDIMLVVGKEILYPAGYVFEPNYNLLQEQRIVVSFVLPVGYDQAEGMQLVLTDKVFGNGIIKALYLEDDLASNPKLKL